MKHVRSSLPTEKSTNSFWHTEPNSFLLGHRTTEELPKVADYVIVGSGITGTSVARFLAEDKRTKGKSIVMLEAREACWGATGRNGGHCQPLLFDRSPSVAAFELKNVHAVKSYIESNSVSCEWRTVSGCRTMWREEIMKEAEAAISALQKADPEVAKQVTIIRDKDELKKHRVSPDCIGATLTAGAGSLWPYKLVTHILEKLVKDGKLNLQTLTPVHEIRSMTTAHGVLTSRGVINACTLILCTNGYTSAILPEFSDLIVPVRGEMSALVPPKHSKILPDSYGMVGALGQNSHMDDYLIQRPFEGVPNPGGHLMFGGGRGSGVMESIGVSDDSVIDEGMAAYLRSALPKLLELGGDMEGKTELEAAGQWTGIMGYSRDNHPWVGAVPEKRRMYLCGGYTGHGMPNGTLCGKAVVDMVLGEEDASRGLKHAEYNGEGLRKLQEEMVKKGDIPKSYIITEERLKRAREIPTVEVQDRTGMLHL